MAREDPGEQRETDAAGRERALIDALRESEARYRHICKAVTDYIVSVRLQDGQTVATHHGPGCSAVTGYSSGDFDADPLLWHRMILPADRPAVEEQIRRLLGGHDTTPVEHRIVRKDGAVRWVRHTSVPHHDADGRLVAYDGLIQDITERRRHEAALEALSQTAAGASGEDFFRALVQHLAATLHVRSAFVGTLLPGQPERVRTIAHCVDGALAETFEYALAGTPCAELTQRGFSHYGAEVQRLFPEDRLLAQLGIECYMGLPLFDSSGEPLGLLVVLNDRPETDVDLARALLSVYAKRAATEIERLRAETQLAEERDRVRRYLDVAGVMLLALDTKGRITMINRKGCEILGLSSAELLGGSWFDRFVPPRTQRDTLAAFREIVAGQLTLHEYHENPVTTASGEERLLAWHNTLLHDASGRVTGTLSSGQDITEGRRAELALRESEQRLARIVETSPGGITIVDRDGTLRFANGAAERLLGLTRSRIQGLHYNEPGWRITTADGAPVPDDDLPFARVMRTGQPVTGYEHALLHSDGRRVILSINAAPLRDEAGEVQGMVAALDDVTDRRRAEDERERLREQLVQAQKMEAMGRLAGGVAHDFNNLLTVILAHAELAQLNQAQDLPLDADLNGIREAVDRARELTRQILAFSRRQLLRMSDLDLNAELTTLGKMLRRLIGEDVELQLRLAGDLDWVRADAAQIQQIVMNLAVNARDALPTGGRIVLETANARLSAADLVGQPEVPPGDYVRLSVSDNGTGMSRETLGHLFEPFFTTKALGRGTGLGLATVYGIVKQHGGHLHVTSREGQGATFHVYLPRLEEPSVDRAAEPEHPARAGGHETILLVEDEPQVRDLTRALLASRGYDVLVAETPEHALQLAASHPGPIGLLLTDVIMPGLNGRELHGRLVRFQPGLRVLYMSGYTGDALAAHGVADEGLQFLPKPFSAVELAHKVREVLDTPPY